MKKKYIVALTNEERATLQAKKNYAQCLREISDEMYPDAQRIVLVQDNSNG